MNDDKIRYRTVGGALVELDMGSSGPRWECTGCGDFEYAARSSANAHANTCRALPRD